jgi:tetratricopeptide (TPR) repeat protein
MILGLIYGQQNQLDLAEQHYRKALEINPDFAPAANNLAYILAEKNKNLNEALELARKAKEILPEDPGIMDTLGWVYFRKGLYESAIVEFAESLEKLPENVMVRYHLGMAYYKKGDRALAKKELEKALSLNEKFDGAEEAKQILSEL